MQTISARPPIRESTEPPSAVLRRANSGKKRANSHLSPDPLNLRPADGSSASALIEPRERSRKRRASAGAWLAEACPGRESGTGPPAPGWFVNHVRGGRARTRRSHARRPSRTRKCAEASRSDNLGFRRAGRPGRFDRRAAPSWISLWLIGACVLARLALKKGGRVLATLGLVQLVGWVDRWRVVALMECCGG